MRNEKKAGKVPKAKSRAPGGRRSALGRRLLAAAKEIAAHERGELQLPGGALEIPDAKAIREELGMTQGDFARRYHLNLRTLQDWEQRRSIPDGAVRAYLLVIARNPAAVHEALGGP
jgi:putative transcriptional regulator